MFKSFARVVATLAVVAAVVPGAASAATNPDAGGQALTYAPAPTPLTTGRTAMPMATVGTGQSYVCTDDGTLRRAPNSYVIGWCPSGTHIDISSGSNGGWQKGFGEGNFAHCGWFQTSGHTLNPEGAYDHNCGSSTTDMPENSFAIRVCDSGCTKNTTASCPRFLNVSPWSSGSTGGANAIATLPSGTPLNWRYQSLNGQWIMTRNPPTGDDDTAHDWAFISSSCIGIPSNARAANGS